MTNKTIDIRLDQFDIASKPDAIATVLRLLANSGQESGGVLPGLQLPALDDLRGPAIELADVMWSGRGRIRLASWLLRLDVAGVCVSRTHQLATFVGDLHPKTIAAVRNHGVSCRFVMQQIDIHGTTTWSKDLVRQPFRSMVHDHRHENPAREASLCPYLQG